MKFRGLSIMFTIALSMVFAGLATASTIETLQFTGTGGISVGGIYTAPYFGTLGGVEELFVCIDDRHQIETGDTWQAYVGSQTDLSHAYYTGPNAAQIYGEEFTLAGQMLAQWNLYQHGTPTQQLAAVAQIQFLQPIAWNLTNPGSQTLSTAQQVYGTSLQSSGSDGWIIASDVSGLKQEFVGQTPEPATMSLIGAGLLGLGIVLKRRRLSRHISRK